MFYHFVKSHNQKQTKFLVLFGVQQDIELHFGPVWESLPETLSPKPEWQVLLIDTGATELRQFYALTQDISAEKAAVSCLNELWQQPGFWRHSFYFSQFHLEKGPIASWQLRVANLSYSQRGWQIVNRNYGFTHVETSVLQYQFSQAHSLASWEFWTHPICNFYYEHQGFRAIKPPPPTGDVAFDLYGLMKVSSLALNQWFNGFSTLSNPASLVQEIRQNLAQYYHKLPSPMRQLCLEQGSIYAEKLQSYFNTSRASSHGPTLWQQQILLALSPMDLRKIFMPEAESFRQQWEKFRRIPWSSQAKKCLKYSLPYGLVRAVQNRKKD